MLKSCSCRPPQRPESVPDLTSPDRQYPTFPKIRSNPHPRNHCLSTSDMLCRVSSHDLTGWLANLMNKSFQPRVVTQPPKLISSSRGLATEDFLSQYSTLQPQSPSSPILRDSFEVTFVTGSGGKSVSLGNSSPHRSCETFSQEPQFCHLRRPRAAASTLSSRQSVPLPLSLLPGGPIIDIKHSSLVTPVI